MEDGEGVPRMRMQEENSCFRLPRKTKEVGILKELERVEKGKQQREIVKDAKNGRR